MYGRKWCHVFYFSLMLLFALCWNEGTLVRERWLLHSQELWISNYGIDTVYSFVCQLWGHFSQCNDQWWMFNLFVVAKRRKNIFVPKMSLETQSRKAIEHSFTTLPQFFLVTCSLNLLCKNKTKQEDSFRYSRGHQPVVRSPLPGHGLLVTEPCDWLASACTSACSHLPIVLLLWHCLDASNAMSIRRALALPQVHPPHASAVTWHGH